MISPTVIKMQALALIKDEPSLSAKEAVERVVGDANEGSELLPSLIEEVEKELAGTSDKTDAEFATDFGKRVAERNTNGFAEPLSGPVSGNGLTAEAEETLADWDSLDDVLEGYQAELDHEDAD